MADPLRILLLTPDAERFRGALTLAAAQAALGGEVALFLQLDAVALLRHPVEGPRDGAHVAAGLPPLATLLHDAMTLGVAISVCQSGLSLAALSADALPQGVVVSGPIGWLRDTAHLGPVTIA